MASTDLTVLDNNLKLLAYPEKQLDTILATQFKFWLSNLLQIKADKEDAMNNAIEIIKKKFWSLGLSDVKEAFEMYALGELDLKPRSNHIDVILVGQIFNAYKKQQRTKNEPFDEDVYKAEQDKLYAIQAFEYYEGSNKLPEESVWLYSYLEDTLGVFKFDENLKREYYKKHLENNTKEDAVIKAKIDLLKACFDEFIKKGTNIKTYLK